MLARLRCLVYDACGWVLTSLGFGLAASFYFGHLALHYYDSLLVIIVEPAGIFYFCSGVSDKISMIRVHPLQSHA